MEFVDRFFETGEMRLHYLEGPKCGPPIVLIHGATGGSNEWGTIQYSLVKDWHVYILEQRGHGQSGRGEGIDGYHASHNINDTLTFLREVVQEPAVVWGHSWGAIVTLLATARAGSLMRAAVLEDPPIMIRREVGPDMEPFMGYFGMLLQMKENAESQEDLRLALKQMAPETPDVILDGWSFNAYHVDANFLRMVLAGPQIVSGIDFAEAIRSIQVPVLLMQADPAMGAALVQKDREFVLSHNPAFQLVQFPGSGHGIHVDQYENALREFKQFSENI